MVSAYEFCLDDVDDSLFWFPLWIFCQGLLLCFCYLCFVFGVSWVDSLHLVVRLSWAFGWFVPLAWGNFGKSWAKTWILETKKKSLKTNQTRPNLLLGFVRLCVNDTPKNGWPRWHKRISAKKHTQKSQVPLFRWFWGSILLKILPENLTAEIEPEIFTSVSRENHQKTIHLHFLGLKNVSFWGDQFFFSVS